MSDAERAEAEAANAEEAKANEVEEEVVEEVPAKPSVEEEEIDEKELDALIDEEKKKGQPDPLKAKESFIEREARRKKEKEDLEKEEADEDRPATLKDLARERELGRREAQMSQARELAKGLAKSEKEAELIVLRWQNRTFPAGTPLSEQLEEVYVGMPNVRKKLIGERNEALRALKNKDTVNNSGASTHREPIKPAKPKIRPADEAGIVAAGYKLEEATGMYVKPLSNGGRVIYDPKTKQTRMVSKGL